MCSRCKAMTVSLSSRPLMWRTICASAFCNLRFRMSIFASMRTNSARSNSTVAANPVLGMKNDASNAQVAQYTPCFTFQSFVCARGSLNLRHDLLAGRHGLLERHQRLIRLLNYGGRDADLALQYRNSLLPLVQLLRQLGMCIAIRLQEPHGVGIVHRFVLPPCHKRQQHDACQYDDSPDHARLFSRLPTTSIRYPFGLVYSLTPLRFNHITSRPYSAFRLRSPP